MQKWEYWPVINSYWPNKLMGLLLGGRANTQNIGFTPSLVGANFPYHPTWACSPQYSLPNPLDVTSISAHPHVFSSTVNTFRMIGHICVWTTSKLMTNVFGIVGNSSSWVPIYLPIDRSTTIDHSWLRSITVNWLRSMTVNHARVGVRFRVRVWISDARPRSILVNLRVRVSIRFRLRLGLGIGSVLLDHNWS